MELCTISAYSNPNIQNMEAPEPFDNEKIALEIFVCTPLCSACNTSSETCKLLSYSYKIMAGFMFKGNPITGAAHFASSSTSKGCTICDMVSLLKFPTFFKVLPSYNERSDSNTLYFV